MMLNLKPKVIKARNKSLSKQDPLSNCLEDLLLFSSYQETYAEIKIAVPYLDTV